MTGVYTDRYLDTYGSTMAITLGLDTSSYQDPTPTSDPGDDIDWAAVARTPYRFEVARMSIGRGTRDATGRRDLKGALDHLPVAGGYGVVGKAEPVEDGAKLLLDEIATVTDPKRCLVMLDAENFGDGSHPTIDQVDRYAHQVHTELGRWPIAYVPSWWLASHNYTASGLALSLCPWAPSHYLDPPWTEAVLQANKPALRYGFKSLAWLQYTSSATVAGVSGRVDANCFYGSLDQLRTQLLGEEDDLTQEEHDALLWLRANAATHNDAAVIIRGDETADPTKDTHPDNLQRLRQDLAAGLSDVSAKLAAIQQALLSGMQVSLTQAQLDEIKAAIQVLEGSALVQLAVSPAS